MNTKENILKKIKVSYNILFCLGKYIFGLDTFWCTSLIKKQNRDSQSCSSSAEPTKFLKSWNSNDNEERRMAFCRGQGKENIDWWRTE